MFFRLKIRCTIKPKRQKTVAYGILSSTVIKPTSKSISPTKNTKPHTNVQGLYSYIRKI